MLRLLPLLFSCVLISSCDTTTEETGARPQVQGVGEETGQAVAADRSYTFVPDERFGPLAAGMDTSEMKRILGPENFMDYRLYVGDGIEIDALMLYPNTDAVAYIVPPPADLPEADRRTTIYLRDPGSPWQMAGTGISVGSSLRDLERINGKPFQFQGFDWDFSGQVFDWNGGTLEGLGIQLGYDVRPQYGDEVFEMLDVWGEVEVSSDGGFGEWLDVRVREVRVDL